MKDDHQHNHEGCDCRDSSKCSCDCHPRPPHSPLPWSHSPVRKIPAIYCNQKRIGQFISHDLAAQVVEIVNNYKSLKEYSNERDELSRTYAKESRNLIMNLEKTNADLVKALEEIIDYGKALQPGPVHPVTFNACAIALDALRRAGGGV